MIVDTDPPAGDQTVALALRLEVEAVVTRADGTSDDQEGK